MLTYLLIAAITAMLVAPFAFGLGGVLGQSKLRDQATATASLLEATRRFLDRHRPLSQSQVVSSAELIRLRQAADAALDALQATQSLQTADDQRPQAQVRTHHNVVRSFV